MIGTTSIDDWPEQVDCEYCDKPIDVEHLYIHDLGGYRYQIFFWCPLVSRWLKAIGEVEA